MPFNSIMKLLDNGIGSEEILAQLKKASPKISKKIQQMFIGGYGASEIVKYLMHDKDTQKISAKNQVKGIPSTPFEIANMAQMQNEMGVPKSRDEEARNDLMRLTPALITAGLAIAPFAMPKILGEAVLGESLGGEIGKQVAGQAAAPVQQALGMGEQPQQPQPGQPPIPTEPPPQPEQPPVPIAEDPRLKTLFIDRNKLGNRLLTMKKAGKSKEDMVDFLKKKIPLVQQEYIRTIGDTGEPGDLNERLEEMVDAYFPQEGQSLQAEEAQGLQGQEGQIPEESGVLTAERVQEEPVPGKEEEVEPFKPQEAKPIGKGSEVLTGQGEKVKVKGISGDNLLVEKDGVIKQVKADEVIDNPIGDKELTKLYDDLISGMEKHSGKEISNMVNLAGYDKDANELTFTGHTGATYAYDNIPQWAVDELDELLVRKTTGESIVGMWEKGTDSVIGARMSKLIQRLKKERREGGQMEYSKKYEQIYDAFAPAKDAKKRILKAKSEEKARLKKELREDEKRRKKAAKK